MAVGPKIECPKCHADRTMLDTKFSLSEYRDPGAQKEEGGSLPPGCGIPVRLIVCVRCHYLELYHDVGLGRLI